MYCLRFTVAVRRHHDFNNSYEGKLLIEGIIYAFRGSVTMIMKGSMVGHMQVGCWS